MRAFHAARGAQRTDGRASAAQAAATCQVLRLVLGPLDLNLLGLVVELYGPNRQSPVTLTITGDPGRRRPGRPVLRPVTRSAPKNKYDRGALAAESFTMRDGERTIRFGEGSAAEAPDLLSEHGFGEYTLLTTPRAAGSAPLEPARDASRCRRGSWTRSPPLSCRTRGTGRSSRSAEAA